MTKVQIEKMSVQISAMALAVSLVSSGFAIYQWWSSDAAEKIRAAIEASNKYIEESIDPRALKRQDALLRGQLNSGQARVDEVIKLDADWKLRKHYSRIDYIAYLVNTDKLDTRYLSQFVICDILNAPDALTESSKLKQKKTLICPTKNDADKDAEDN